MADAAHNQFRMRRSIRQLGVTGLVFFCGMSIASGAFAFFTPNQIGAPSIVLAAMFATPWLLFVALSLWILRTYSRYSLSVTPSAIQQITAFHIKNIPIQQIHEAEWRLRPRSGSIVLRSTTISLTIEFDPFTTEERQTIVSLLQECIPVSSHRNWGLFHERFVANLPVRRRQATSNARILSLVLFVFGQAFLVAAFLGLGYHLAVIGVVNSAAAYWVYPRISRDATT